ncbi:MAG: GAF domain-containing sensor histidine kinase [Anaerolineae bacterium]|nr:GAF domain-containing sensor histidine kinase [Anaerolineae bacterium]
MQASNDETQAQTDNLLSIYRRIIEISQQLSTTYDLQSLLRKIVIAANELIHTEASAILLMDEASGKLRFAMSSNIKPHEMDEMTVPLDGSIAGWIFTHGEPRVIENASEDPDHYQGVDDRLSFHTRNLLGVPMKTPARVIGVVQALNKIDNQRFTDDDIAMLRTLASQAAVAIENARMFQQSDFIAELVHELRNPLVALKASTTLLLRPDLPGEKHANIIRTMQFETERLIGLTDDFLNVARLESGRVQLEISSFSMHHLLEESAQVIEQQAHDKGITISLDGDDHHVAADRGKIKQVLINLLSNAVKYNIPQGTIYLNTGVMNENGDRYLQVDVTDTGYGIPAEHQKNMFQKFFRVPTTANMERGTGLGLTVCKGIIEAHSGRIWLESEEGQGSTFSFTVPLSL